MSRIVVSPQIKALFALWGVLLAMFLYFLFKDKKK